MSTQSKQRKVKTKQVEVESYHRKTAIDFERWLEKNSNVSLKRKINAFDTIADQNYKNRKRKN